MSVKILVGLMKRVFGERRPEPSASKIRVETPAVAPAQNPTTTVAEETRRIVLPGKFDDWIDFGRAEHSPTKAWSVGYFDPGPDASQQRKRAVQLRDNVSKQIVARVDNLERPFEAHVSDAGIFGVNDAGQSNALSAHLVIYDTRGSQIYSRRYEANLFSFGISPCGRFVVSQTCNAPNKDANLLEIHDVKQNQVLASRRPAIGWADKYRFEVIDGELTRLLATNSQLGTFAYSPSGEFLDARKYSAARLTKGDPWTRISAAKELVQVDESTKTLEKALKVINEVFAGFREGQDDRWLSDGYRVQGELLEKLQQLPEALIAYRSALAINPKIGVKKRATALEKALAQGSTSST